MSKKQPTLTLHQAQQKVNNWITQYGVRYFSELTNMAILTEEVGEVARIISREYGDQSFKKKEKGKKLGDELADVLFVLICLANQTGVDRSTCRTCRKLGARDAQALQSTLSGSIRAGRAFS